MAKAEQNFPAMGFSCGKNRGSSGCMAYWRNNFITSSPKRRGRKGLPEPIAEKGVAQAKELADHAQKVATETVEPMKEGFTSAFSKAA